MTSETGLQRTHTSSVTQDQIDHLGHMNVRYYAANAAAGNSVLLASIGLAEDTPVLDRYTRHHHEQMLGTDLELLSGVLAVDESHASLYHELRNATDGDLAATFINRVGHDGTVDPATISTIALPSHGATRSIDLAFDPLETAPSIDTLRDRSLAMRKPRPVGPIDTDGQSHVPPHLMTMLIWGGESIDDEPPVFTHEGPEGQPLGWATMENRIRIADVPALNTPIQSFGAVTSIADKTTTMSMWTYNCDTGEVLVTFDVVNLCFDIQARRAISIPDNIRALERLRHHPDLGPPLPKATGS